MEMGFIININGAETHFLLCELGKMVPVRESIDLECEKYVKAESCVFRNREKRKGMS